MDYRYFVPPGYRVRGRHYPGHRFSQNLQHHLWDRESGISRHGVRGHYACLLHEREFYKSITPNLTIQNVDKPLGYMRKFTPDGRLLLSFSNDQRSLEVYAYRGVGRAAQLLQRVRNECITAADHSIDSLRIRQQVFQRLFRLRWCIALQTDSHYRWHLNREFSIFLDSGRYVLLAAMGKQPDVFVPAEYFLSYPDLQDAFELFDYDFVLVDLHQGGVSDVYTMRRDFIALSHNHGVSAYGHTIAILSRCRQCIELLEVVRGKLVRFSTVNCVEVSSRPFYSMLSSLKQRTLAHIYRDIVELEDVELRRTKLRAFYRSFKIYERMSMIKMQLIDADNVLIRFECPDQPPGGHAPGDDNHEFKLYVFYCISVEAVLKVYPQNSVELLYLLRNFYDTFRNAVSLQTGRPSSSPSNNTFFRYAFDSAAVSFPGGPEKAAVRFNATLPIGTQSFATTPYLDYNLFIYDDRLVSALERPKVSSLEPIRFSDRRTNFTKFRLFLEPPSSALSADVSGAINQPANNRELVAFIFHPYEPFIITIQKLLTRYVVNFHIYNEGTRVRK